MPPKKDSEYVSEELKIKMLDIEETKMKLNTGLIGRLIGGKGVSAHYNAGLLLTVLFSAGLACVMIWKPDMTDKILPLVTLSLGYTFGSKPPKD